MTKLTRLFLTTAVALVVVGCSIASSENESENENETIASEQKIAPSTVSSSSGATTSSSGTVGGMQCRWVCKIPDGCRDCLAKCSWYCSIP